MVEHIEVGVAYDVCIHCIIIISKRKGMILVVRFSNLTLVYT